MSGFLLEEKERDRFLVWLDQQAASNEQIVEQLRKNSVPEALVKQQSTEALACRIVANMIRSGESVTLR